MRRIAKFFALAQADRRLLIHAWLAVWAFRAALWVAPLRVVRRLAARCSSRPRLRPAPSRRRICWAVATAGRYVPRSTCLVQALAAQFVLARHGAPSHIHIGVAQDAQAGFQAHAWLECDGEVLMGKFDQGRYQRLLSLEERTR